MNPDFLIANMKLINECLQNTIFILGDMSNLDSKVDSTKAKVEELKDKWGSGELKIEELKSSHHEIKGNFITYYYLFTTYNFIYIPNLSHLQKSKLLSMERSKKFLKL